MTSLALLRPSTDTPAAASQLPLDDAHAELARQGDPGAWEAAYLTYGRQLMGFLMVRLDNRDDAAEALSETFTRAIEKSGRFRGDARAFRAWLFQIARNASVDRQRARRRLQPVAEIADQVDVIQVAADERVIQQEDVAEVRRAFAGLSPDDQEILWLRVCSGLSAAEVGEIVSKRSGAVRMQQMRALDLLSVQVSR